jgi:ABC-type transport system involved in Fe-S cluster assembly fused permease/ATPase subunit
MARPGTNHISIKNDDDPRNPDEDWDIVLFNQTLACNIAYGRPDAGREEVVQTAECAELDHFIESLPHGYDIFVGERGLKLCGGEK